MTVLVFLRNRASFGLLRGRLPFPPRFSVPPLPPPEWTSAIEVPSRPPGDSSALSASPPSRPPGDSVSSSGCCWWRTNRWSGVHNPCLIGVLQDYTYVCDTGSKLYHS